MRGGTWFPVSLPQSQGCESADAADAAAVDSASAEPVSVWSDGRHPGPTNCAVSYTHTEKRQRPHDVDAEWLPEKGLANSSSDSEADDSEGAEDAGS